MTKFAFSGLFVFASLAVAEDQNLLVTWIDEPARILKTGEQTTLRVKVTDSSGTPVTNIPVVYLAPASGPAGVFVPWNGDPSSTVMSTVSGDDGIAALLFEANSQVGPYLAEMRLPTGASVTFGMTNVAARGTSPSLAASAARSALEKKLSGGGTVYGPVWLPTGTAIVSAGPSSVYATATSYTTQTTGTWLFWIDPTPGRLFGHPVQYVTADAGRLDLELANARYTREIWWPQVKVSGSSGAVALVPPSLTLPLRLWQPVSTPGTAEVQAPAGNCAMVLGGPAALGAETNVSSTQAFYQQSGIAAQDRILASVDETGAYTPATRAGLAQLVQKAVDLGCSAVYFNLTANGFPPRAAKSGTATAGTGGVVLQAADGTPSDFMEYTELAAALLPLKGVARLEAGIEASYAGTAAAAFSGLGLTGDLLMGADETTPQASAVGGTPLGAALLTAWKGATDPTNPASFVQVVSQAVKQSGSAPVTQSNPSVQSIATTGAMALAVPSFALTGEGSQLSAVLPVPGGLASSTAITVAVTVADPRVGSIDVSSLSFTAGQTAPTLTAFAAGAGATTYTVKLTLGTGAVYQGTGTVYAGQEMSCSPARIILTNIDTATIHLSAGALYDARYNGTSFTAQTPGSSTIRLDTTTVAMSSAASGADIKLTALAVGNTTVEVKGTRAVGAAYTACIVDVTVVPFKGADTVDNTVYLVQTGAAAQSLGTVLSFKGETMVDIAVPAQASTASGSELICALNQTGKYATFPSSVQAFQQTVLGASNAQAVCTWTPAGSSAARTQFSTFFGSTGTDYPAAIAADAQGNVIVVGSTANSGLTVTSGLRAYTAGRDLYVAKISRFGDKLLFSTYFGGTGDDVPSAVALDAAGNVYVTGYTLSVDMPTRNASWQVHGHGGTPEAFVLKLDGSTGKFVYSSYFGGSALDYPTAIAVDSEGLAYIAGLTTSLDLPVTAGAYQSTLSTAGGGCVQFNDGIPPCADAFAAKFSADGSSVLYATYLGGTNYDVIDSIAVDAAGNAVLAGATSSSNFPTTTGAYQTKLRDGTCSSAYPCPDAFVTVLNPSGTALVASTLLGGAGYDEAVRLALDSSGNVYLTGLTTSTAFPVTTGAFQSTYGGGASDAFVAAFNSSLTVLRGASYFGGSLKDTAAGIAVGRDGRVYFSGNSTSRDLPQSK